MDARAATIDAVYAMRGARVVIGERGLNFSMLA